MTDISKKDMHYAACRFPTTDIVSDEAKVKTILLGGKRTTKMTLPACGFRFDGGIDVEFQSRVCEHCSVTYVVCKVLHYGDE